MVGASGVCVMSVCVVVVVIVIVAAVVEWMAGLEAGKSGAYYNNLNERCCGLDCGGCANMFIGWTGPVVWR